MNALRVRPLPALTDNYIWLASTPEGRALVVDPGESEPVLAALQAEGLELAAILLTHHHGDHIGGVAGLLERATVPVFAPFDERIALATQRLADGDTARIEAMPAQFQVIGVPGHTRSHIAFFGHDLLFSGDTLFSVGCGRIFEGTPAQMLDSLERLAQLPDTTALCCGHEYTVANCAFARTIEPDNAALQAREAHAQALRRTGTPTVPATLASERACNPFLRIDAPTVIAALAGDCSPQATRVERFAALRRRKDDFRMPGA